jgi:predicted DNA-binding ribbon-helix-helix protein
VGGNELPGRGGLERRTAPALALPESQPVAGLSLTGHRGMTNRHSHWPSIIPVSPFECRFPAPIIPEINTLKLKWGTEPVKNQTIKPRSVLIGSRKTKVSLEDAFWDTLQEIAIQRTISVYELLEEINRNPKSTFSSAIRIYVLEFCRDQVVKHQKTSKAAFAPAEHISPAGS